MKPSRCIVCREPITPGGLALCAACRRSYDRAVAMDASAWHLVLWAAGRAWRAARKAAR